jgi:hypothetical protein
MHELESSASNNLCRLTELQMKFAFILKLSAAETFSGAGKRVEAKWKQTALSSLPVGARISASYERRKPYAAIGWDLRRVRCHAPASKWSDGFTNA